jgi:hypothetical protein
VQVFVVPGGVAGEPLAREVLSRQSSTQDARLELTFQVSCLERSFRMPPKLVMQMLGCCFRTSQRSRQRSPTRPSKHGHRRRELQS